MKISERLLAWQVLLSLSEGKGFSLAADKFGRDEAFYCRLTHGLETEIGIRLTEPHSRPVRLTQEAIELLPEIECYLEAAKMISLKYANGLRNGANSDTHRCKQLTEHGEERCIKLREVAGFSAVRTIFQIVGPRKILHCLLGK